jgi:hypothetical protein
MIQIIWLIQEQRGQLKKILKIKLKGNNEINRKGKFLTQLLT